MDKKILPKNIRQMGDRDDLYQIYLEDYAYTYIRKLRLKDGGPRVGVLVGKTEIIAGNSCQFIYGALDVKEIKIENGIISFPEDAWKKLHSEIQAFFSDYELCGWYVKGSENQVPELLKLQQAHAANFPDAGMLLFLGQEEEYSFWTGTGQNLFPVQGYYVFYERNEAMQDYMVRRSQGQSIESESRDQVTRHFRTALKERQEEKLEEGHRVNRVLYGVCAAMGVLVIGLGIAMFGNYDKLRGMEESLHQAGIEAGATAEVIHSRPVVETVPGNLSPTTDAEPSAAEESSLSQETTQGGGESGTAENKAPSGSTAVMQPWEKATVHSTERSTEKKGSDPDESGTAAVSGLPVNGEAGGFHVVEEGDTLMQISIDAYGTIRMVEEICELNGITDPDKIVAGQKLKMP